MQLFERVYQFREWIRQTPDDSDHSLISEYIRLYSDKIALLSTCDRAHMTQQFIPNKV